MGDDSRDTSRADKLARVTRSGKLWRSLHNFHPILFAVFPPVSLYAINLTRYPGEQIIRSLVVLFLIGSGLTFLGWVYFKEVRKATILASLILFFSTNYGHVFESLNGLVTKVAKSSGSEFRLVEVSLAAHIVLFIAWIALLIAVYKFVTRKETSKQLASQYLFFLALIAILIPSIRIAWSYSKINSSLLENPISRYVDLDLAPDEELGTPDVFYIFLDGYGREDILDEFFGYDNSYFIDDLEEMGFFVGKNSRSNYSNTISSLASSINMNYLEGIADIPSDDLQCRMLLSRAIDSSEVMRVFKELGYEFIAFSTGFPSTEITEGDVFLEPEDLDLNPFESLLVKNSILLPLFEISSISGFGIEFPGYSGHRGRMLFTLEQLRQFPVDGNPKFVFAHIVAPHPPFVFDAEGQATDQRFPFVIWDGDMFPGTTSEYVRGYSEQISFLNSALLTWLEEILGDGSYQPVIILQGDHGPRSTVVWRSPSENGMREGTGILNAYFLPGVEGDVLYDQISPVNTFRVILNNYFGAGLELLPDRTFFMSTGCQDFSFELK